MTRQLQRPRDISRPLQKLPENPDRPVVRRSAERRLVADLTTRGIGIVSLVGMLLTLAGGPFEVFLTAFFIAFFFRLLLVHSPLEILSRLRRPGHRMASTRQPGRLESESA